MFGFERIGAVAFKALERALTLAAGRQRKDQVGPAAGASRTFSLAHAVILPSIQKLVNSKNWATEN
jgi:hypothetical protein